MTMTLHRTPFCPRHSSATDAAARRSTGNSPTYWRMVTGLRRGQRTDHGTPANHLFGVWLNDEFQPDAVQADATEGWVDVRQLRRVSPSAAPRAADTAEGDCGIYQRDLLGEVVVRRISGRVTIRRCED